METIHDTLVKFQISPKTLAERDFAQVGQNCNPYRTDSAEWKTYERAYNDRKVAYDKDTMFEPCYDCQ